MTCTQSSVITNTTIKLSLSNFQNIIQKNQETVKVLLQYCFRTFVQLQYYLLPHPPHTNTPTSQLSTHKMLTLLFHTVTSVSSDDLYLLGLSTIKLKIRNKKSVCCLLACYCTNTILPLYLMLIVKPKPQQQRGKTVRLERQFELSLILL